MVTDPDFDIAFRRPGLMPAWALGRLGGLALVILAGVLTVQADRRGAQARMLGYLVEFALLTVALFAWQLWLRRRGGLPAIRLGPEVITLPRSMSSLRTTLVPYAQVRCITALGHGVWARIILDTERKAYVFPRHDFAAPDALARLQSGLLRRMTALPDGGAQWQVVAARHALAADIGDARTYGTWGAVAAVTTCFALQLELLPVGPPLVLLDAGGNSGLLVQAGEWFRLVTANLLHASPQHLLGNMFMLGLLGTMLERLIGLRQFLVVLLATAVASQFASAMWGIYAGGYVVAVGASGALFGLLGALAVITWRFRGDLPGGYRLPWQVWVFLFGINMLLLPSLNPQVDKAAHAGGLLAGLMMGVLLVEGRVDLRDVAQRHVRVQSAMAILGVAWIAGLAGALAHAYNPPAQAADRYTLAHAMLEHDHFSPGVKNEVAWAIAADPAAPPSALSDARLLAYRGVEEAERAPRGADTAAERARAAVLGAAMDTEAALEYRLGYPAEAAALQVAINDRTSAAWGSHLALFLEQNYRHGGARVVGGAVALPVLTLEHGLIRLEMAAPAQGGGEAFALLHHDGATIGVVQVRLPPGFMGSQILPLPTKSGAPTAEAPDPVWTDGRATLDVAWYDHTNCHCAYPAIGPYFYRYSPQLASLP
jgi:membrane associated rhomboid family serine protease